MPATGRMPLVTISHFITNAKPAEPALRAHVGPALSKVAPLHHTCDHAAITTTMQFRPLAGTTERRRNSKIIANKFKRDKKNPKAQPHMI